MSLPAMMKAVRIAAHGDIDVLEYGDHPLPALRPHEVLVRVLAASVSGWDVKYRRGHIGSGLPGRKQFPLPMQPGRDAAGVVEAVGAEFASSRLETGWLAWFIHRIPLRR